MQRSIFERNSLFSLVSYGYKPLNYVRGHNNVIENSPRAKCELTILMYLDDVKLYAGSDDRRRSLSRIVGTFSGDVRMEFGYHLYPSQDI